MSAQFGRHRLEIETDFFDRFPLEQPGVAITGENADFEPPNNQAWGRISLQQGSAVATCINHDRMQTDGLVSFQVFAPVGDGARLAALIADSALKVFATSALDRIEMRDFTVTIGGQADGFYQLNLIAAYRAYDD